MTVAGIIITRDNFEEIYASIYPSVFRFVLWKVSCRNTAEDLTQEIFAKVWKARQSFKGDSKIKTWVMKIAGNHIIDHYKSNKQETNLDDSHLSLIKSGDDTESNIVNKDQIKHINKAIESMPPACRDAFILVRFEEMSYQEAAEVLNISMSALKVRVHRAHGILTELFREGAV
jgi:RNA polymerase sigma-70 factor (ECF subfamily)